MDKFIQQKHIGKCEQECTPVSLYLLRIKLHFIHIGKVSSSYKFKIFYNTAYKPVGGLAYLIISLLAFYRHRQSITMLSMSFGKIDYWGDSIPHRPSELSYIKQVGEGEALL